MTDKRNRSGTQGSTEPMAISSFSDAHYSKHLQTDEFSHITAGSI